MIIINNNIIMIIRSGDLNARGDIDEYSLV